MLIRYHAAASLKFAISCRCFRFLSPSIAASPLHCRPRPIPAISPLFFDCYIIRRFAMIGFSSLAPFSLSIPSYAQRMACRHDTADIAFITPCLLLSLFSYTREARSAPVNTAAIIANTAP